MFEGPSLGQSRTSGTQNVGPCESREKSPGQHEGKFGNFFANSAAMTSSGMAGPNSFSVKENVLPACTSQPRETPAGILVSFKRCHSHPFVQSRSGASQAFRSKPIIPRAGSNANESNFLRKCRQNSSEGNSSGSSRSHKKRELPDSVRSIQFGGYGRELANSITFSRGCEAS
jgi:hypothetical protein